MRPVDLATSLPSTIEEFAVEWDRLVVGGRPLDPLTPYLVAIARFGQRAGARGGIFAHRFALRRDLELERLLAYVQTLSTLQSEVVPLALGRSNAWRSLSAFGRDPLALEAALRDARFSYVSPFLLEGVLAEYLFWYGTYERFYSKHSANEAALLARGLLGSVDASDLEAIVPFQSRLPWGTWFDPTSSSDATFVILNKGRRELVMCCFSHSAPS